MQGLIVGLIVAYYTDTWKARPGRLKHILVGAVLASGLCFAVFSFAAVAHVFVSVYRMMRGSNRQTMSAQVFFRPFS